VTGGLLILANPLAQGEFVEVAFQTSEGSVHGTAEVLQAKLESRTGCVQPFRFVALDDQTHDELRMALQTLVERTTLGFLLAGALRFSPSRWSWPLLCQRLANIG
jgi:hypothetical protein